ncbi:MAG TPA: AAA family ATPase [Ramlibacter sp.]|nr:AAA family ATPase [Ramlibacter sp.]
MNDMTAGARLLKPGYIETANEVSLFEAAWRQQLPVLIKGPTGVGKTRFVEHMAERLQRPLVTVACHEDLTAADLVGRYLLQGNDTVWVEGPLTRAVKQGAICYLDEVVEARSDTIVVLHPLMDHRRELHIERLGATLKADDGFMLVMTYNPGYQTLAKDLKASTRQRMVAIEFGFPSAAVEHEILCTVHGIPASISQALVALAQAARRTQHAGLAETVSTRALISAGRLAQAGVPLREAVIATTAQAVSDDPQVVAGLSELVAAYIG